MKGNRRWVIFGCGGLMAMVALCVCAAFLINVMAPLAGMPPILATVSPTTSVPDAMTPTSAVGAEVVTEPTGGLGRVVPGRGPERREKPR